MTTWAPSLAKSTAVAWPMPESDPVITAVLLWSRIAVPPACGWTRTGFTRRGSGPAVEPVRGSSGSSNRITRRLLSPRPMAWTGLATVRRSRQPREPAAAANTSGLDLVEVLLGGWADQLAMLRRVKRPLPPGWKEQYTVLLVVRRRRLVPPSPTTSRGLSPRRSLPTRFGRRNARAGLRWGWSAMIRPADRRRGVPRAAVAGPPPA